MTTTVEAVSLPFDEAIDFFRQKANVTTRSYRDVWGAAHSKAFMVAGAATDALVSDFRSAIDKALADGTTLDQFRADFDTIVAKHGWDYKGGRDWRSRVIFETNMRTAHAAGRYAQLTAPGTREAFPFWQYRHSGALHPRQDHLSWDGTVLSADDPFWDTNYPPNGFGCGCYVIPVSPRGLRRQGKSGPDPSPNLDQLGTDPRGVDPGWAYNPGKAWLEQTAPGPVAVSANEVEAAAFVRSALAGKQPAEAWTPVAIADDTLGGVFSVPAGTEFRLSADTIVRHLKHAATTPAAYGVIPRRLIDTGAILRRPDGRMAIIGEVDGELWNAAVKVVERDGRSEIYLSSLHRTNSKQRDRWLRLGTVLRR